MCLCVYFEFHQREQDYPGFLSFLIINPAGPGTHFLHSYYCCPSITHCSLPSSHLLSLSSAFFSSTFTLVLPHPLCLQSFDVYSVVGAHQKDSPPIIMKSEPPRRTFSLSCSAERECVTGALKNGWQLLPGNIRRLNKFLSLRRKRTIFNMLKFILQCSIYAEMKCNMNGNIVNSTSWITFNFFTLCVMFWAVYCSGIMGHIVSRMG